MFVWNESLLQISDARNMEKIHTNQKSISNLCKYNCSQQIHSGQMFCCESLHCGRSIKFLDQKRVRWVYFFINPIENCEKYLLCGFFPLFFFRLYFQWIGVQKVAECLWLVKTCCTRVSRFVCLCFSCVFLTYKYCWQAKSFKLRSDGVSSAIALSWRCYSPVHSLQFALLR